MPSYSINAQCSPKPLDLCLSMKWKPFFNLGYIEHKDIAVQLSVLCCYVKTREMRFVLYFSQFRAKNIQFSEISGICIEKVWQARCRKRQPLTTTPVLISQIQNNRNVIKLMCNVISLSTVNISLLKYKSIKVTQLADRVLNYFAG